jgi:glucose-6-phosphate 1-dehydrogenase
MDQPMRFDQQELRDRKIDVLRSIRPPEFGRTRRARYSAGRLAPPPDGSGDDVPAYAHEDGVEPERQTETFAEVALELEGERWAGTQFVLRAGKALSRRRKLAIVRFRTAADELRIGLDGPDDLVLQLTGGAPAPRCRCS